MGGHVMKKSIDFHIPSCKEFREGYEVYNQKECRGPVYFEAVSIISKGWGDANRMSMGIHRLIRSWNWLYSNFDINKLVECINVNLSALSGYRKRNINSLSDKDHERIIDTFEQFLEALKRKYDNQKSAVSVAKALNPLAPHFFPIWDAKIAFRGYKLIYLAHSSAPVYLSFCKKMKLFSTKIKNCAPKSDDRSLLKRIDEYNYSKYTRMWIK